MIAHLALNVTTLCRLWKITAKDGTIIRAANHTQNVTYNSELYLAVPYKPTQMQNNSGLSPSNAEMAIVFQSGGFLEFDLVSGKWYHATVEIFTINYNSPVDGYATYDKGHLGEITITNGVAQLEYRSTSDLISQEIGDLYSPTCRYTLGDANCTVTVATFQVTTTIGVVTDRKNFTVASAPADGYYLNGKVTFNNGPDAGLSMEIKNNVGNALTLVLPMPSLPVAGNSVLLTAGDDKQRSTCVSKFSNGINFGGEPDLPGISKVIAFPD